jgi:L-threonylcarbamoyladenylate synthase
VIYRHGGVTSEMLAAQLGYVPDVKTQEESGVLTSGMVKHHYATATPLFLGYKPATASETSLQITIGPKEHISGPHIILSQNNSLTEAARNLYASLHQADAANATAIYVEPFPNEGLGKAMNDRLNRAAAKFQ